MKPLTLFVSLVCAVVCIAQQSNVSCCSITGRLTNKVTGAPVRKAKINISRVSPNGFSRETASDVNGNFAFAAIPAGLYRLFVQRDGFISFVYGARGPDRPGKPLALSAGGSAESLNIALEPLGVISGRVLDEDGEPVQGIGVQALKRDKNLRQYTVAIAATTDDTGQYRLFGLQPGRFIIATQQRPVIAGGNGSPAETQTVYGAAFYPGTTDLAAAATLYVAGGGEARDIDIRVIRATAVSVRGSILNMPAGVARQSMAGFQIVRKDRAGMGRNASASGCSVDSSGQFECRGLTPGIYVLFAWLQHDVILYAREEVSVGGGDVNDVRLALMPGVEITGNLQDGSALVSAVTLTRTDGYGPGVVNGVVMGGSVEFNPVTPGTWRVEVALRSPDAFLQSIGYAEQDCLIRDIEIQPNSKGTLKMVVAAKGGSVAGTVRSMAVAAQPMEGAAVLLVPQGALSGVASYIKTAICDAAGRYALRGIAPGQYRIYAFEDMDPMAYRDPDFLNGLNGKGREISVGVGAGAGVAQDLIADAQ